jgi:uncharacterized Zn finger protein
MGGEQAVDSGRLAELSLTEHDIRRWVGEASFGRGLIYYRGRHIRQARRRGSTLHARCSGSEAQPYRLWVTLSDQGIADGRCTCYVGAGGRCKHVAALLLTWLYTPEQFLETSVPASPLELCSKDALVDLIHQMIARYPDLESLVDERLAIEAGTLAEQVSVPNTVAPFEAADLSAALAAAEGHFWLGPDLDGYVELRDLYRQAGQWEARQSALLAQLGDEGYHRLLTRIYLQEGQEDRALDALGPALASPWGSDELALHVAGEVEATRPRAALLLYRHVAERAIASKTRHHYATAAHLLTRVRALYRALGEPEAWEDYIKDLREEHRRLRAFQDELNKAGIT